MCGTDQATGKMILILASCSFLYYTLWVLGLPFIDDSRLQSLFYSPDIALMVPAITGLCFVGGLVLFTLFHLKPYICQQRS